MTQHRYPMLTLICTTAMLVVPVAAFGKAACELKQMVTGEEFESLQKQWNVDHALPKSRDSYGHKDPDDKIYFYDTTSQSFKKDAILRWRKSDGKFTIKNRSDADDMPDAQCQIDFVSETSSKKSCQYDTHSEGHSPKELKLSKEQKDFLQTKNLQWDASRLVQMGPIHSYQTSVAADVCSGLGNKSPIEFESWIMENAGRSEMVYEVSVKVKDPDKCADRNQAFRSCLGKAGVDVKDNRGTKTEAVYKFFQPEKSGPD